MASIKSLASAAQNGNWDPLTTEATKLPGKYWMEGARCIGQNPELFMPPQDGPHEDPRDVRRSGGPALDRVLSLCGACPPPVAARCLVDSLQQGDHYGIRGGLLASERRSLRSSWSSRLRDDVVRAVLRGAVVRHSQTERREVIRRFAADTTIEADDVARGLGVSRGLLIRLAWQARNSSRRASAPPDADAG